MKLTIAVCDDNAQELAAEYTLICKAIAELGADAHIDRFYDATAFLNSDADYNIVFLDVELGSTDGIEIAKTLHARNSDCHIFFVTNYEKYLDRAFDRHAFRFWTKPLDAERLASGIKSAIRELDAIKQTVSVKIGSDYVNFLLKNIIYVYVSNKILHIVSEKGTFAAGNTYKEVYKTLGASSDFVEIKRGYCVNFNFIRDYSENEISCECRGRSYDIKISRRKYKNFCYKFVKWMGEK